MRWKIFAPYERTETGIYEAALNQVGQIIQEMNSPGFFAKISTGVEMILTARKVGALGFRAAKPLAQDFFYRLKNSLDNIVLLSDDSDYIYDYLSEMNEKDLIIVFASVPYVKTSGDIARLCKHVGIPTLLVGAGTETEHPLAKLVDHTVTVGMSELVPTNIPSQLITDLLIKGVQARHIDKTVHNLSTLDIFLQENGLTIWEGYEK